MSRPYVELHVVRASRGEVSVSDQFPAQMITDLPANICIGVATPDAYDVRGYSKTKLERFIPGRAW